MKRWGLSILAVVIGSGVGTQVFALQTAYHPALGRPLAHWHRHAVYQPWDGWRWAWQWAGRSPGRFKQAGLATLLATTGLLVLARRPWETQDNTVTDVSAEWATVAVLRKAGLTSTQGIVFGELKGTPIVHDGPEHVLVIASTQSGKTQALVIPTIRRLKNRSLVVNDPKGELIEATIEDRSKVSDVFIFDPLEDDTCCYDPLAAVRIGTRYAVRDAELIAEMLGDPDGDAAQGSKDDAGTHFRHLIGILNRGLILHGLHTGKARNLGQLNEWFTMTPDWRALVAELQQSPLNAVRHAGATVSRFADRELSSVQSTAARALSLWTDDTVCRATSRSDFTLDGLRNGRRPVTLYLRIPFSDQDRMRPFSRLLVRQVIDACTQRLGGWTHRLLFIVDEFPALNRMPILGRATQYTAGYGLNLMLISPSFNAILEQYGRYQPFTEGCRYQVVFGINDNEVAARFASRTGMRKIERQRTTVARDTWNLLMDRKTYSTEEGYEPLLSATALGKLPPEYVLLLRGGGSPALLNKAWDRPRKRWGR